jgi:hypothetical protein
MCIPSLERFSKLSRNEAPDERQPPRGADDVSRRLGINPYPPDFPAHSLFSSSPPTLTWAPLSIGLPVQNIGMSVGLPLSALSTCKSAVGSRCLPKDVRSRRFPRYSRLPVLVPFGQSVSVPYASFSAYGSYTDSHELTMVLRANTSPNRETVRRKMASRFSSRPHFGRTSMLFPEGFMRIMTGS